MEQATVLAAAGAVVAVPIGALLGVERWETLWEQP